jgi:hypothetical protein
MADRSSRPHRVANRTPQQLVRKGVHLRWKQRLGPVAIGAKLAMPASTVHAVLVRCRLNRLHHVDKRTGEVIRRYVGRQGKQNRAATPSKPRSSHRNPLIGTAYVHTVIDDHSRVAYAEIHSNETATTAVGVLKRAVSWFAARGVTVERVLSDNGSAYKSHLWRDTCREWASRQRRPGPTARRPTERSNASTEPSPTGGPSNASTPRNQPAETPSRHGCTTTITTDPTPQSEATRPSAA